MWICHINYRLAKYGILDNGNANFTFEQEWLTTFSAAGEAEAVPDMDLETLAHYRRFEAAWAVREGVKKGWNKTEGEDDDGEDGGVKLEEGEDEAMVDFLRSAGACRW